MTLWIRKITVWLCCIGSLVLAERTYTSGPRTVRVWSEPVGDTPSLFSHTKCVEYTSGAPRDWKKGCVTQVFNQNNNTERCAVDFDNMDCNRCSICTVLTDTNVQGFQVECNNKLPAKNVLSACIAWDDRLIQNYLTGDGHFADIPFDFGWPPRDDPTPTPAPVVLAERTYTSGPRTVRVWSEPVGDTPSLFSHTKCVEYTSGAPRDWKKGCVTQVFNQNNNTERCAVDFDNMDCNRCSICTVLTDTNVQGFQVECNNKLPAKNVLSACIAWDDRLIQNYLTGDGHFADIPFDFGWPPRDDPTPTPAPVVLAERTYTSGPRTVRVWSEPVGDTPSLFSHTKCVEYTSGAPRDWKKGCVTQVFNQNNNTERCAVDFDNMDCNRCSICTVLTDTNVQGFQVECNNKLPAKNVLSACIAWDDRLIQNYLTGDGHFADIPFDFGWPPRDDPTPTPAPVVLAERTYTSGPRTVRVWSEPVGDTPSLFSHTKCVEYTSGAPRDWKKGCVTQVFNQNNNTERCAVDFDNMDCNRCSICTVLTDTNVQGFQVECNNKLPAKNVLSACIAWDDRLIQNYLTGDGHFADIPFDFGWPPRDDPTPTPAPVVLAERTYTSGPRTVRVWSEPVGDTPSLFSHTKCVEYTSGAPRDWKKGCVTQVFNQNNNTERCAVDFDNMDCNRCSICTVLTDTNVQGFQVECNNKLPAKNVLSACIAWDDRLIQNYLTGDGHFADIPFDFGWPPRDDPTPTPAPVVLAERTYTSGPRTVRVWSEPVGDTPSLFSHTKCVEYTSGAPRDWKKGCVTQVFNQNNNTERCAVDFDNMDCNRCSICTVLTDTNVQGFQVECNNKLPAKNVLSACIAWDDRLIQNYLTGDGHFADIPFDFGWPPRDDPTPTPAPVVLAERTYTSGPRTVRVWSEPVGDTPSLFSHTKCVEYTSGAPRDWKKGCVTQVFNQNNNTERCAVDFDNMDCNRCSICTVLTDTNVQGFQVECNNKLPAKNVLSACIAWDDRLIQNYLTGDGHFADIPFDFGWPPRDDPTPTPAPVVLAERTYTSGPRTVRVWSEPVGDTPSLFSHTKCVEYTSGAPRDWKKGCVTQVFNQNNNTERCAVDFDNMDCNRCSICTVLTDTNVQGFQVECNNKLPAKNVLSACIAWDDRLIQNYLTGDGHFADIPFDFGWPPRDDPTPTPAPVAQPSDARDVSIATVASAVAVFIALLI